MCPPVSLIFLPFLLFNHPPPATTDYRPTHARRMEKPLMIPPFMNTDYSKRARCDKRLSRTSALLCCEVSEHERSRTQKTSGPLSTGEGGERNLDLPSLLLPLYFFNYTLLFFYCISPTVSSLSGLMTNTGQGDLLSLRSLASNIILISF